MKFHVLDIIPYLTNPVTGRIVSPSDRFAQTIQVILSYHQLFRHDLQSISLPTTVPFEQQLEILERFATEVIPTVRHEAPTTLWGEDDPYGARPAFAGA